MWCYLFALAFSIRTGCFSDWSFEFFCLNFYKTLSFIFFRIKGPAFALSCGSGCISRMDNFSGLVNSRHKAYFTFLPLLVCLCFHKTPSPLNAGACVISPVGSTPIITGHIAWTPFWMAITRTAELLGLTELEGRTLFSCLSLSSPQDSLGLWEEAKDAGRAEEKRQATAVHRKAVSSS